MKPRGKAGALAALGGVVASVGIILASYGFPKMIADEIQRKVILKDGSESFDFWQETSFPLSFKVYIFNVTNPEEVVIGRSPSVFEVGPYVYRQHREKINITFDEKNQITYFLKKKFTFDQEKSKELKESDFVITLNTALMGLVLTVNKAASFLLPKIDLVLPQLFNNPTDPFLRTTVADLLFDGILINCTSDDAVVGMVCKELGGSRRPRTMRTNPSGEGFLFSMFAHLNNTLSGPLVINSGREDVSQLGQTINYMESDTIEAWEGECSLLNGTDSTIFPPVDDSKKPGPIYIFEPEVCRSLYAEYTRRGVVEGLPAFHYEAGKSVMESFVTHPDNLCFCPEDWSVTGSGCSLDGVLGLQSCQGVPLVASHPHFYLGSPSLGKYVDGVHPDKLKHQTFVDIEPRTGAILKGAKRMQLNMELAQLPGVTLLTNVSSGLFPVVWIEEAGELYPNVKIILEDIYHKVKIIKVLQWVIVATGIVLVLGSCAARGGARVTGGAAPDRPRQKEPRSLRLDYSFRNRSFCAEEIVSHK